MPALACFSSRMAIRTLEHRPGQLPAAARRTGPMSEQGNPYREEAAGIVSRLFAIAAQRLEREGLIDPQVVEMLTEAEVVRRLATSGYDRGPLSPAPWRTD